MTRLHPSAVLHEGRSRPHLPVCDHYAGSEKLMRKSIALQHQLGPVFDITLDCEDGAAAGREVEHAALVASIVASPDNRYGRIGVRVHDVHHLAVRTELDIILGQCGNTVAYVTFPKVDSIDDAHRAIDMLNAAARACDIERSIPIHVLIESPQAVADVNAIAACPQIECLSFGLMDFVSAHGGAIPDLAMRSPGQFEHPLVQRAKLEVAAACHAWGKVPSHNVTTDFSSPTVAGNDAARAAQSLGYLRMWSIHPSQIEAIVAALRPSIASIEEAAAILLAAHVADWGPIQYGGRLHDRASYRYYWNVLQQAHGSGAPLPAEAAHTFFGDSACH